jgi:hypothetical protein
MKWKSTLLAVLVVIVGWMNSAHAGNAEIDDFTFDGCSMVPEGLPCDPDLWCECCLTHDIAYWKGGTYNDRLNADRALKKCVTEKSRSAAIGELFYVGVRAGGSPYYNTSYRWGFGWEFGRGYKSLTPEEEAIADEKIQLFFEENPDPCEEFTQFP